MSDAGCGQCASPLRAGARFCGKCGWRAPAEESTSGSGGGTPAAAAAAVVPGAPAAPTETACGQCGARAKDPAAAACAYCGAALAGREAPRAAAGAATTRIAAWERPPDAFVKRVRERAVVADFPALRHQVPAGSFAAVLGVGGVEAVLEPGAVVDAAWWHGLRATLGGRPSLGDVVLLDLRPVPVVFALEHRRPGGRESGRFESVVEAWIPRDDRARLAHFLEQCLHGAEALDARAFYELLRPVMGAVIDTQMAAWPAEGPGDLAAAAAAIESALQPAVEARFGLEVRVRLSAAGRSFVLEQSFGGEAPAAAAVACGSCGGAVAAGKPFCNRCGAAVGGAPGAAADGCARCGAPFREGKRFCGGCGAPRPEGGAGAKAAGRTTAPLQTRDGRSVQVDVLVRGAAAEGAAVAGRLMPAVRATLEAALREQDFAALTAPAGLVDRAADAVLGAVAGARGRGPLGALQRRVEDGSREAASALGVEGFALTLVDLREVGQAWLLAGRAALERARGEYTLGRSWLDVDADASALQDTIKDRALEAQQREWARDDRRLAAESARKVEALRRAEAERLATIAGDAAVAAATQAARNTQAKTAAEHDAAMNTLRRTEAVADATVGRDVASLRARGAADDKAYAERLETDAKLAKLRAMAALDAQLANEDAAREEARLQSERAHELERQRLAEQARVQHIEAQKSLSAEQILAMNTAGDAAAAARAFAAKNDADRLREAYAERERLRADDQSRVAAERDQMHARQAQLDAMVQQTLQATLAMAQTAMASQGQRVQETLAVHAQSADRAERVATASMHAMAGAVGRQPVTPVTAPSSRACVNAACRQPVTERFCDSCGAPQS